MLWNLAEDLQAAPTRVATVYFSPPLAGAIDATAPFDLATDRPAPEAYSFDESYVDDETAGPGPELHPTTRTSVASARLSTMTRT